MKNKIFGQKEILVRKIFFWSKTIFSVKIIFDKKDRNFQQKKIWSKKIWVQKIFLDQKHIFQSKYILK